MKTTVSPESRELAKWECILFKVWLKAQPKRRPPEPKPKLSAVTFQRVDEPVESPKLTRPKSKPWRGLVKDFMRTRTTPATIDDIAKGLGVEQEADRLKLNSALHHMGMAGILHRVGETPSGVKSRAFVLWKLAPL